MKEFADEIRELLSFDTPNNCTKYNPFAELECLSWKTKFKKRTKSHKTMLGFFFMMVGHFLSQQFYVFPAIFPNEFGFKTGADN